MEQLTPINSISEPLEYSMEGVDIGKHFRNMTNLFNSKAEWLQSVFKNFTLSRVQDNNLRFALKKIKSTGMGIAGELLVSTPEGVIGEMVPYLVALDNAMEELSSIDKRVIRPLQQWAGNVVADASYMEKVWLQSNVTTVDIRPLVKDLSKHYDDRASDDLTEVPLSNRYPVGKDLETASELLTGLNDKAEAVLALNLAELATITGDLLNDVTRELSKDNSKEAKRVLKQVSELSYQAASEIELVSVLIFQIKVAVESHNRVLDRVRYNL